MSSAHKDHPRTFSGSQYVYPVLSRRSGGISIGINLSPDKICNFNCVYCQVKRTPDDQETHISIDQDTVEKISSELIELIEMVYSGALFQDPKFTDVPEELRKLCDISFSGDGEPTSSPIFDQMCLKVADVRRQYARDDVKIVLITNSTLLHKPKVQEGLAVLDTNNGEIWAKLDAGTEQYYQSVNRSEVSFEKVLENILRTAQKRPIKIQSLFMTIMGRPPADEEISAYINCLKDIAAQGGKIISVQIHTVARQPAETFVNSLSDQQIDDIAAKVNGHTGLKVEHYYGSKI
ncbi:MAG: radical SAM protein [Spirochaetes bacterium]|nr:radical SAM protein [Spirochaetota bacterium]